MGKTTNIYVNQKRYGLGRFLLDLFLGVITGGIWWIWLAFKFLRNNS